jgi:5-(carboxyamino)imidazole ribonucleotide synthase
MEGPRTIALLGGGQLGRMFIENALRYDVRVHVLDPDPAAPCAHLAHRFEVGDLNDVDTVVRFAADADVVGIEIEHVSTTALDRLKALGKQVIPDPEVLRTIKDKGLQKEFYRDHGIKTADFALIEQPTEIAAHANLLPAFLKLRTGGYDGKGVMMVDTSHPVGVFEGPCVLEERVDIQMELAVIVVRDRDGNTVVYDPVEMVFDQRFNLVDHLRAPARISLSNAEEARTLARTVVDGFGAPGLYAVELFLTVDGRMLVNETAPRAHNSGHHTIEACASSQFDQLLRVYLGLPLGDPTLHSTAAMINLVGEGGEGEPILLGSKEILAIPRAFPHLYGKARTRTGRKMGHVTLLAEGQDALDHGIALIKTHGKVVPEVRSATIRN